ncbi:MAG: hypothetical protein DRQ48_01415 [Gammaproteobacteria bacterium]|nr:MAG: hypothetical protein DRQ58_00995 [Gammaproteobacteria bacterium]RKZ72104.1 MAG: hypothetical protein DRQ48_01415 [Gammaproteobacteria bacterium]
MSIDLVNHLSSGEGAPRLWIDFNAYTKKLLLGEGENPWTTPASYMSFYSQAHGLVSAEVVVLDVWDLFHHWMLDDEDAIPSMAGKKRITVALKKMLEAFAPRELLAEVLTAVSNNYAGAVPIVLVMPSPRSLLAKAHKAANGDEVIPEESHVDTAAMYVADFLRYYSETDISGVLLMEDSALMPESGEEISWYQPVFNVAKHYRWSVGLHLPFTGESFDLPDDVNFSIVPAGSSAQESSMGVDISSSIWAGQGTDELPGNEKGFYYLTIPEDTKPEFVLETISSLRE